MSDDKHLTRKDLALLMESYQNMFLMHKNILDQQTTMSDSLKEIIKTQNAIVTSQSKDYNKLNNIVTKLDTVADQLEKTYDGIDKTEDKLRDKIDDLKADIKGHNDNFLSFLGSINAKFYIAYGGSATIILALLALFFKS